MDALINLQLQSILQTLESPNLKDFGSVQYLEYGLAKLNETVVRLRSVVHEAEAVEPSEQVLVWLKRVKEVLYDVDDLLDEMCTQHGENQMMLVEASGNKEIPSLYGKVRLFLSTFSRVYSAINLYQEIAVVKQRLDAAAAAAAADNAAGRDVRKNSGGDYSPTFEVDDYVVGRDADKKAVMDLLVGESDLCFVTIVGLGGLGKTALARLIYNDERISEEFPLRMWVRVSDSDGFDMGAVTAKILAAATGRVVDDLGSDQIQSLLSEEIAAASKKKYLLVLDDVWSEDRDMWLKLRALLGGGGGRGSKVLVTTRSETVGIAIGKGLMVRLQGLTEEDAWCLFKKFAFEEEEEKGGQEERVLRLSGVGKEIARKCAGVPLALRVVGSLVRGQAESRWREVRDSTLATMTPSGGSDILAAVKLSYDHLPSALKMCFCYFAVFPKHHIIEKEMLINLWMAQGFIIPAGAQSIEDTAEEYFMFLLHRCFFQDVNQDDDGDIISCKLHDLMHDIALEMAQKEILVVTSNANNISEETHHLAMIDVNKYGVLDILKRNTRIRTFLKLGYIRSFPHKIIDNSLVSHWRCLRVLVLHHLIGTSLPNGISELRHLRYLDLSYNPELEMLPSSVTKLHNLQTLLLRGCSKLKALPVHLSNLVNLRCLDMQGCNSLTQMGKLGKLTSLSRLSMFVVSGASKPSFSDQLEELGALTKLRGSLKVRLLKGAAYSPAKAKVGQYLMTKEHLKDICIQWDNDKAVECRDDGNAETLLDSLEPHPNLRSLTVKEYPGVSFPRWQSLHSLAPATKIVTICLEDCTRLQHLPPFGQLRHLKALALHRLVDLEYVESDCVASVSGSRATLFFPSLERLSLISLPKLKGWWRGIGDREGTEAKHQQEDGNCDQLTWHSFPCLSQLKICQCPNLISIPLCPNLENLDLYQFNEMVPQNLFSSNSQRQQNRNLRRMTIDDVECLKLLPLDCVRHLSLLVIRLSYLESFSASNEVLQYTMPSLQSLQISLCSELRVLSGLGWKHLTVLKRLSLSNLPVLELTTATTDGEEDNMPWKLLHCLSFLELDYLPKLVYLPKGIQYLTSLQNLEIRSCRSLEALPEWIACLTQLESLCIEACIGLQCLPKSMSKLTNLRILAFLRCSGCLRERCRSPTGSDWPIIQHVPYISFHP